MPTIIPGLDFTVNEIPTRLKFLTQALGLTISDLTAGDLDEGIRGFEFGADSGATGAFRGNDPLGSVWIDPGGDPWVQDIGGPVKLSRIEGGWETRRTRYLDNTGFPDDEPGKPLVFVTANGRATTDDFTRNPSGATETSTINVQHQELAQNAGTPHVYPGILLETGVSGIPARWLGRGASLVSDITNDQSGFGVSSLVVSRNYSIGRVIRTGGIGTERTWYVDPISISDFEQHSKCQIIVLGDVPSSNIGTYSASLGSRITGDYYAWHCGIAMFTTESRFAN